MDPQKLKEFLLQNFDKIAIGLAGLFALFAVGGYLFGEDPVAEANQNLGELVSRIRDNVEDASRLARPLVPPTDVADVRMRFDNVPSGQVGPEWLSWKRPYVHVLYEGGPTVTPTHSPPRAFTGVPDRGQVRLSWQPVGQFVRFVAFEIWRTSSEQAAIRAGDENAGWAMVQRVDGAAVEWTDTTVEPQVPYWYYMVSIAEVARSPQIPSWATLDEANQRKQSGVIGSFVTPRDIIIAPMMITVPTPADLARDGTLRPEAMIRIFTWDTQAADWTMQQQTIHEQDHVTIAGREFQVDRILNLPQAEALMLGGTVQPWTTQDAPIQGLIFRDLRRERRVREEIVRQRWRETGQAFRAITDQDLDFPLTREEERRAQMLWRPALRPGGNTVIVEEPPIPTNEMHRVPPQGQTIQGIEVIEVPGRRR